MSRIAPPFLKAALAAAALAALVAPAQAQPELKQLQFWTTRDVQQGAGPIVAARQGLFQKNGIDVELKFVSSGAEIPPGMTGGSIQIALASWTNSMQMAANAFPVRVLAQTADISEAFGELVIQPDRGITSPRDLDGKKVGITRIGMIVGNIEKMCAAYGCTPEKLQITNVGPQDLVLAFQKKEVDAVITWEPWGSYAVAAGGKLLVNANESYVPGASGPKKVDGAYAAVFALNDFVAKNPKTASAVLKALREAAVWTNENKQAAAEIVSKEINIPVDVVHTTLTKVKQTVAFPKGWDGEYDQMAAYLAKIGETRKPVTAKDVFATDPLKAACAECVE